MCYRRSREGAWIEIDVLKCMICKALVAPVRERGLKFIRHIDNVETIRRSREGAWIEILKEGYKMKTIKVAPVRERGLKWGSSLPP